MWEEADLTYLGDDVTPFVGSCAISGLSKTTRSDEEEGLHS